jgi:nucleoside-diphosphate-sugar epimerase
MGHDAVVTGAGGFIGGHLTAALIAEGRSVRAVDIKPVSSWQQAHPGAQNLAADLSTLDACQRVLAGITGEVYHLAADMGGMGFIARNKAACMLSVLPSTHMLLAARDAGVSRYFYASSACVYAAQKQASEHAPPLREEDAYPAMPEDGYGWEKLFGERMARHFREDFGLGTRVARFHNVYGPHGTWRGGREKAPAALCRKVAVAALTGQYEIDIWGDGQQTRSFLYMADCIEGTLLLARSDWPDPVNIGSAELVTIDQLVDLIEQIAGIRVKRRYQPHEPQGVRGRCSDNTLVRAILGWEPSVPLQEGLAHTYRWIYDQVAASLAGRIASCD